MDAIIATDERFVSDKARPPPLHRVGGKTTGVLWVSNAITNCLLLLLLNTTRTHSGPPSTGATITMDGGVAYTAHANTRRINTGR